MSDNTLRGARSLGKLAGTKKRSGFVGQSDKIDIFKFTLTDRKSCSFDLSNLTANANLELLNSKGRILKASRKGGTKAEGITRTLNQGTYYLRIRGVGDNTSYRLKASATPPPDDTPTNAHTLGILTGSYKTKNFVGTTDVVDYYKFTLNQISDLSASIVGSAAIASMALYYDANKNGQIESSESFATASGSLTPSDLIFLTLPKGTYFVEVKPGSPVSTDYTLTLSATANPGTLATDPGDATASYDLGALSSSTTVKDYVGKLDGVDYFKFTLTQISDFSGSILGSSSTASMTLYYDANGNGAIDSGESVDNGSGSATASDPISMVLPKGTYFVGVNTTFDGSTKYDLTLTATANAGTLTTDPGTATSPYNIGVLSSFPAKDYVGKLDGVDYFKFTLSQISDVSATIAGSPATATMTLYYDANNNGLVDSGENFEQGSGSPTSSSPVSTTLPKGTYFVEVETTPSAFIKYDLSLTAIANPGNLLTDPGSITSPYDIGSLSGTFSAQDYVGELDSVDFYKFSLAANGSFSADIIGEAAIANMTLYHDDNSNGVVDTGESTFNGSGSSISSTPISRSLDAGDYLLKISTLANIGNGYDLTLTFS
jgi:Bacterial pre-peptidase C-terminal domain